MSEQIEEFDDFEFSTDGIEESTDVFTVDFDGVSGDVNSTTKNKTTKEVVTKDKTTETFDVGDTFEVDELGNTVTAGEEGETVIKGNPSTDGKGNSSSKTFGLLASALYQDGILSGISEEDLKDVDSDKFVELMTKTIKNNEYADLSDQGKQFLEAVRNGVPIETMAKIHNTELQLENLTEDAYIESDEDDDDVAESKRNMREQLIFNDLRSRNISEVRAKRMVAAAFKEGADEEDAKNAIENLKATVKQNKAAQISQAKAEQLQIQEQRNALVDKIIKSEEILPGIKVPEKLRSKIAKNLTEPTGRDANGRLRNFVGDKRSENPELFDTRLNYLIELGIFDEKPDLSIFGKQKMSSAVKNLEKELGNDIVYEGGRGTSLQGVAERENAAKMLSLLDNIKF